MRSIVWNPQLVAAWNLALASMESRTKGKGDTRQAVMLYAQRAIPYNSLCELMPYQALRSWINKKTNRSSSFYFGGPSRARTLDQPVMSRWLWPTELMAHAFLYYINSVPTCQVPFRKIQPSDILQIHLTFDKIMCIIKSTNLRKGLDRQDEVCENANRQTTDRQQTDDRDNAVLLSCALLK